MEYVTVKTYEMFNHRAPLQQSKKKKKISKNKREQENFTINTKPNWADTHQSSPTVVYEDKKKGQAVEGPIIGVP